MDDAPTARIRRFQSVQRLGSRHQFALTCRRTELQEVLPRIFDFIGGDAVCAQNARFDSAVLSGAAAAERIDLPRLDYVCTLTAARRCMKLGSYRLPFVADALGVSLRDHHDPGADAFAAAQIVPGLAERMGVASLEAMLAATQTAPSSTPLPTTDRPKPNTDQGHPLWGRVVVFTGPLSSMTRRMAHDVCIGVGAMPEKNVTARTNVLVIGDLDPMRLVPGDLTSPKAQKAFTRQAAGQDIEVMTEYDFLRST